MNPKVNVKRNELESSANSSLEQVIRTMTEHERNEREKLSKKYTPQDEKEAQSFEEGYRSGFRDGEQRGFGLGWDAAMKEAKKEQEEEEAKQ